MTAHYIIFHPEREKVFVTATVVLDKTARKNWSGNVWVDKIGAGNEDPYVFNEPWLYSYCHASQLRRNFNTDSYLKKGSKLIFVNGKSAEKGYLTIDTFFIIGNVQKWQNPLNLPKKYQPIFENKKSSLWERHFKFQFCGIHKTVSHTYEAEIWSDRKSAFSFLPLNENNERISIPISIFSIQMQNKINGKIRGKYPILLNEKEILEIELVIENFTNIKVVKVINHDIPIITKENKC